MTRCAYDSAVGCRDGLGGAFFTKVSSHFRILTIDANNASTSLERLLQQPLVQFRVPVG